ncbi:MAG TPA: hypothetical protein VED59_05140, partial [Acidimicrobiales bacterium]|nr:hypothetical protein [Acidimicrobiales bacterium]
MSQNGDTIMPGELPEPLVPLLSPHLARQRWYAGDASASPSLRIVESGRLGGFDDFPCQMLWAIVRAEGAEYQLLIGERADLEARGHVSGEEAMIGTFDGRTYYDATADAEMALWLLSAASGGLESAKIARPVRVEQSNTSLVYDDRLILKVFRRVHPGPNPEAEVTTALVAAGFEHVALPFARWQHHGRDLAFGQQYLAGGTDGWALALTSLRDFYATPATEGLADPALSGGDFAAEATRLGLVTAEMHLC